jgi:hypothetical protein
MSVRQELAVLIHCHNLFNYGLRYDGNRPTPNKGLQAYAISPKPPAAAPRDHAAELTALRIERIKADFAALTPRAKAELLQTLTLSANQTE